VIKKIADSYILYSKNSKRRLGKFKSLSSAEKRERQVNFFKALDSGRIDRDMIRLDRRHKGK
jgi:hypothetical protein